jgi:hypothetical protein
LRRSSRGNHTPTTEDEFWRHAAIDRDDPAAVRSLEATARGDGRTTMATGWTLARSTGLDADALALLRDGFESWRRSVGYERALGRRFLEQMLGDLMERFPDPEGPSAGSEDAIAVHVAASCWVAGELLGVGVEPVMERWLHDFVTVCPLAFVTPDAMNWAFEYAARHDLPAPWL